MDKIFGEIDFVDAGEQDSAFEKIDAQVETTEKKATGSSHTENAEKGEEDKEAQSKKEEPSTEKAVDNPVV